MKKLFTEEQYNTLLTAYEDSLYYKYEHLKEDWKKHDHKVKTQLDKFKVDPYLTLPDHGEAWSPMDYLRVMNDAKDLRIGNLVTVDNPEFWPQYKDVPLVVDGISRAMEIRKEDGWTFSIQFKPVNGRPWETLSQLIQFVKPIPLTAEWLLHFGFESSTENAGNLPCFKRGKITIAMWGTKWQAWLQTVDIYNSPQYVHGLQNLYFALTGTELQIKP